MQRPVYRTSRVGGDAVISLARPRLFTPRIERPLSDSSNQACGRVPSAPPPSLRVHSPGDTRPTEIMFRQGQRLVVSTS